MSFGTTGSIPDRLLVEYDPSGRASCKTCGSVIPKDSVRIGEKVRSPWHDGFDIKWNKLKCGLRLGRSVHDFKGFQRLKWADQLDLAEKLSPGSAAATAATVEGKRVARLNEMIWEAKAALAKVPKAALKELIEENEVYVSEKVAAARARNRAGLRARASRRPRHPAALSARALPAVLAT